MKIAVLTTLAATASAFTAPSMTFAVGKKPAPKKAAAKPAATKAVKPAKAAVSKAAAATKKVAAPKKAFVNPFMKKDPAAEAKKVVEKKAAPVKKAVVKKAAPVKKAAVKAVKKAPAPVKKAVKAVVKKAPAAKAPAKKATAPAKRVTASGGGTIPSIAIPYEGAPALLDGSLVGDVGFDPCFLSTKADTVAAPYFNGIFNNEVSIDGLTWYREAELMHGRICMIAVVGFIAPGFGTFEGNAWTGADAFSNTNPLEALGAAPSASIFQIFAFMAALEFRRINIIFQQGNNYQPGDSQRWGQGDGRWNPLGLNYSPEEYEEKQLQEVKHARLAMVGLLGLLFQANASGVNVIDQLSAAFVIPEYIAKSGYYFPDGI